MKKFLLFAVAGVCVLAGPSSRAAVNLVQDPGFESGEATGPLGFSSSPWYSPNTSSVSIATSNPHSGTKEATLVGGTGGVALFQNMAVTAGAGYAIRFWAATSASSASSGTLTVNLDGTKAGSIIITPGTLYTEYYLDVSPKNPTGYLDFVWSGSSGTKLYIDDVFVGVPEPTTMVAGALMLLPFAASTLRLRKKVS